ncbi:unnamed protein product [Vitrella brassicaformis CCMP3155]|uniref:MYND-type domain-containing protein n=1 Tax=Vitrella brassicaformis (strain CCMP3155) TaxID=1169540 RepID=A0A0G4EB31_VITBC|nr:unnamed protein product [Vitrella brassicaformis CCMP3155]|eukprot:CEL92900.1 unnamed protein product [Vitrella brassicaformis CCMP3155]
MSSGDLSGPCAVCGEITEQRCSLCKARFYCCKAHQRQDWKSGHKHTCPRQFAASASTASPTTASAREECRASDWDARHKYHCKEMGDLMSEESQSALRSCRAAIMHLFGYMDEGEFQRVLARGQTKIIQEVLSRTQTPPHSRHLHLNTRRYNDTLCCVVALSSASCDGTQPPLTPPCATTLDPTGKFVVYRVFNMARVAEPGTPLPLPSHKLPAVMERVKATVTHAIEVCVRESHGRLLPNPLIECDLSEVGPLFWWKSSCVVGDGGWFFMPTVGSVCESAMKEALVAVLGPGMYLLGGPDTYSDPLSLVQYLSPEEWRRRIVAIVDTQDIKTVAIHQHCGTSRRLRAPNVKRELIEKALDFTDLVRNHLFTYVGARLLTFSATLQQAVVDMPVEMCNKITEKATVVLELSNIQAHRHPAHRDPCEMMKLMSRTIARLLGTSEANLNRMAEELASLNAQYAPHIQALIDAGPP